MKISDIKTDLFTQTTIMDFGVQLIYFNDEKYKNAGSPADCKGLFIVQINVFYNGSIRMMYNGVIDMPAAQLDEIQRVSELLRSEIN